MRKSEFSESAALSAQGGLWQSRAWAASGSGVKRIAAFALLCCAGPIAAAPGGEIGVLRAGKYVCELPGDATGPAGRHVPEADFTVSNASSYEAGGASGSYLLTGDQLVMTSGPFKGKRFHRISNNFLRLVEPDGTDGQLRCVRRTQSNR